MGDRASPSSPPSPWWATPGTLPTAVFLPVPASTRTIEPSSREPTRSPPSGSGARPQGDFRSSVRVLTTFTEPLAGGRRWASRRRTVGRTRRGRRRAPGPCGRASVGGAAGREHERGCGQGGRPRWFVARWWVPSTGSMRWGSLCGRSRGAPVVAGHQDSGSPPRAGRAAGPGAQSRAGGSAASLRQVPRGQGEAPPRGRSRAPTPRAWPPGTGITWARGAAARPAPPGPGSPRAARRPGAGPPPRAGSPPSSPP